MQRQSSKPCCSLSGCKSAKSLSSIDESDPQVISSMGARLEVELVTLCKDKPHADHCLIANMLNLCHPLHQTYKSWAWGSKFGELKSSLQSQTTRCAARSDCKFAKYLSSTASDPHTISSKGANFEVELVTTVQDKPLGMMLFIWLQVWKVFVIHCIWPTSH